MVSWERKQLKILVACEESQAVCIELRNLWHEAYSCDILPCSWWHPEWHIQWDVLEQLDKWWDMMIAFPPCTHLASSWARHFAKKIADGRQQDGIDFFMRLVNAPIMRIAIENPVGIMSSKYRKPDQIIQPYQFWDSAKKTTCLRLKNLPKLEPTQIVEYEMITTEKGNRFSKRYYDTYSAKDKSLIRSKTFPWIAKAMAEQWTKDELYYIPHL